MSPRPRPDFVQIRLSAAGRAFAGEHPLHLSTRHMQYTFTGAEPTEVLRHAEWRVLQKEVTPAGEPLFELAEGEI